MIFILAGIKDKYETHAVLFAEKAILLNDEVYKMEMILQLYFPVYDFDLEDMFAADLFPYYEKSLARLEIPEDDFFTAIDKSREKLHLNSYNVNEICQHLMSRHGF